MNPMRRFALVALLAVGVALFASTQAWAAGGENWGTIQLTNVGDEPQALGEASLTSVKVLSSVDGWGWTLTTYSGNLSVSCKKLTPGAVYQAPAGIFIANRRGRGKISGKVHFQVEWYDDGWSGPVVSNPYLFYVIRRDPTEFSYDETLVLMGTFVPPGTND